METATASKKVQSEGISSSHSLESILSAYRNVDYRKVLVSHDGLEMSDKALAHAMALSKKISDAQIVLLNVIDYVDNIPPSLTLAYMREDAEKDKESLRNDIESGARHILEQRVEYCKKAGITQTTL